MKKTLSIILAIVTVLSTAVFAAPVTVGTVEATQEVAVDAAEVFKAEVAEETTPVEEAANLQAESDYGCLIYTLDLEKSDGGLSLGGEIINDWQRIQQVYRNSSFYDFDGFDTQMYFRCYSSNDKLYVADDGTGNKAFKMDAHYKWSRLNLIAGGATSFYPAGDYTLVYDLWIEEDYDWSTSHLTQLSTSVASSGTDDGNVQDGIITLYNPEGKLTSGTNKLTNTFKFRVEANKTNRFQIMQDARWNDSNADLTVTSNVSNLTFTYYLDNIKLYYQGPATVTFSSSVEATVPEAVTGVLPGTKLDLSDYKATVADENKEFFGWSLTQGGEVVTELEVLKDTTLYAVYRDAITETHPTYGQLAYWVDFDNGALTSSNGTKIDYYKTTTKVVKAPSGMPNAYGLSVVTFNSGTTPKIADGTMQTDGGYPRINIAADAQNPFPDGYYTVVYAAKASTSTGANNSVMANGTDETLWSTGEAPIVAECAALTTELTEYSVSFTKYDEYLEKPDGKKLSSSKTSIMDDLGKIGVYFTVKDNDRTVVRLLDYMKVYYMPFADVTFDANGKDVAVPTSVTDIHKIKLADYTCQTAGTSRFVGWSATPNGKLITEEEIVISSDTTLYAVWDDNFEPSEEADAGYLLANLHFNGKSNADNTNSRINNYGTLGVNEYVDASNVANAFPKIATLNGGGIWFDGSSTAGDSTSKFLYDEAHKDNEYVKTASKQSGDEVYPKVGVVLYSGGSLADGVYTVASEIYIPAGQENVASVTYNAYVYAGGDKVANKHDISIGERVYVVDSILVLNGEVYDPETMERKGTFTVGTNNVEKFGLNFNVKAVDASKPTTVSVHADNFKIYYKPYTYAPKSYNENSIRVNDPSGLRFKASVDKLVRNNKDLAEYGYIVSRQTILTTLGVEKSDFTMENTALTKGTHYVQGVSYGKVDGKDVDRVFEQTATETYFTAVVYNIPSNMYKDVIVVRPYVKIGETVTYGDAMSASIYEVAQRIAASDKYEDYKTAVDKILNGEEL